MSEEKAPPPNTYVREIWWYRLTWWGVCVDLAQDMLGMSGPQKYGSKNELDPKRYNIDELREYFGEYKLDDGNLGYEVFLDSETRGTAVGMIETTLPYDTEVTDEMFLSILEDYSAYVRGLPLADPHNRPGSSAEEREEDVREMNTHTFENLAEHAPEVLKHMLLAPLREREEAELARWYKLPWRKKDTEF